MLNSKGQTLVMFVIIIPILILVLLIVFNISNIAYKKKKLCNITYEAVYYALSNDNEDKVKDLIYRNDNDIEIESISYNPVVISNSLKVNNNFKSILDLDIYNIKCSYKGYIDDNKKIIERIK